MSSGEYMTASEDGHNKGYLERSSEEPSADSSATPSRPSSSGGNAPHKKSRVRFNSTSEANDTTNQKSSFPLRDRDHASPLHVTIPKQTRISPAHSRAGSISNVFRRPTPEKEKDNPFADPIQNPAFKPRPSLLRNNSSGLMNETSDVDDYNEKTFSALAAQERAQRIASLVGSHSAPGSRRTSLDEIDEEYSPPPSMGPDGLPVRIDDVPLMDMDSRRTYDGAVLDTDEDDDVEQGNGKGLNKKGEAHKLVRAHSRRYPSESLTMPAGPASGLVSGQVTPEKQRREDYVPRPPQYRGGILSSLLKLYNQPQGVQSRRGSDASTESPSRTGTNTASLVSSGRTTPKSKGPKWYNHKTHSQDTLAGLIEASAILGAQGGVRTPKKPTRPGPGKRTQSGRLIDAAMNRMSRPRLEDEIRITIHIAETLSRQKYLLKLCRALMSYGAPTHRLEEYMKMSARVLEIDGQFLYIPGCMIISFDDVTTHTTEVKIVRANQGVDLGRLKDVHEVYKEVTHDMIGVEEATQRLDSIIKTKPKHNPWLLVFVYGLASATVGPFAFEARLIDLPIAFLLGCLLGFLQLIVAPKSELYNNVFEISAAVLTSFLARAFGSIRGGDVFCFSALAQSSIALILPGYLVLCGSLELQSKNLVAGSVRMVYAIIYALFLGYGITIGTAIYGLMDSNATSSTSCSAPLGEYYKWLFVPAFTLCLCVINQAKWKQTPVMLLISFAGYIVNFFTSKRFPSSAQLSNTFGALTVGVLGNLYSRVGRGVAAAALIPAIFVQVPSGLAAGGSLLAGISSADQITNTTTYANGTAKINGTSTVRTGGDGLGGHVNGSQNLTMGKSLLNNSMVCSLAQGIPFSL
ncbi:DUF1212-domain-containing protein [Mollisia scopiformis]|uniref:DUF1212-domain-containing protein n=1 Tax=Mollisia scopiformis TaxID=149040 RepID=A0A194XEX8_MOLSC|nr:DUF1212-domain-containing protein [Mollisia scopiformis]KUJ18322.1 DUF1212-domain-containing protein [Mollisia scopiformis]